MEWTVSEKGQVNKVVNFWVSWNVGKLFTGRVANDYPRTVKCVLRLERLYSVPIALTCFRDHKHVASKVAKTIRNMTCSGRCPIRNSALRSYPDWLFLSLSSVCPGKFWSRLLAFTSFLINCVSVITQAVYAIWFQLVKASLIELRTGSRVAAKRAEIERTGKKWLVFV